MNTKQDNKSEYIALFDGLVDIVEHNGVSAFLVQAESGLSILPKVEIDNQTYLPPQKDMIPCQPLPSGERVMGYYKDYCGDEEDNTINEQLFNDLWGYHAAISELPRDFYNLIAAWDIHTYLLEKFQYTPIICLFADPEKGKSRTGMGMIHVAYRGVPVFSVRDAYLIRLADYFTASIFFDTMNFWESLKKEGSKDLILSRFNKGLKVPRVIHYDKGRFKDIEYFSVFGPTVIATNEPVHHILETRAIQITMPESNQVFDNEVTPEGGLLLKEKLLAFRARYLWEPLPPIPKPAKGRLGDILKPLIQVLCFIKPDYLPNGKRAHVVSQIVDFLETQRKREKSETPEAQILKALIASYGNVRNNVLPVKDVCEKLNEGRPIQFHTSPQKVGRKAGAMGFHKSRTEENCSAIIWDQGLLILLCNKYGVQNPFET